MLGKTTDLDVHGERVLIDLLVGTHLSMQTITHTQTKRFAWL